MGMSEQVDQTSPDWDASTYDRFGRFVSAHGGVILSWLAAKPGEQILDAGCGDGVLTKEIARQGAHVRGIERAGKMADAARALGLDVREMDLLALEDEALYDAVFSSAVFHWIDDWPDLLDRLHRALKAGGRLVAECGGDGNIALIRGAIGEVAGRHGLALNAGPERYYSVAMAQSLLAAAGFEIKRIELQPRPTPLAAGMRGWLSVFREPFFRQIEDDALRRSIEDEVLALLKPALYDPHEGWFADYVRLRFEAVRANGP